MAVFFLSQGGSILWMMEHFLTIEVFNRGIRNYLKERAYKNANTEHLWQELTEVKGKLTAPYQVLFLSNI